MNVPILPGRLGELQRATFAARKVDPCIGTSVQAGSMFVERVIPNGTKTPDVVTIAGPFTLSETIDFLKGIK